jgi:CHAD domain-containing protein
LEATRKDLSALSPLVSEPSSAVEGVRRTYSTGRKAWIKAKSRGDDALHEWRKQAKYLLNELELLHDIFGLNVKKLRRRARKIGDLLGDDHDLSVLSAKIRHYGGSTAALLKRIKKRRCHLQRDATKKGKKLYSHRARQIAVTQFRHAF